MQSFWFYLGCEYFSVFAAVFWTWSVWSHYKELFLWPSLDGEPHSPLPWWWREQLRLVWPLCLQIRFLMYSKSEISNKVNAALSILLTMDRFTHEILTHLLLMLYVLLNNVRILLMLSWNHYNVLQWWKGWGLIFCLLSQTGACCMSQSLVLWQSFSSCPSAGFVSAAVKGDKDSITACRQTVCLNMWHELCHLHYRSEV